MFTVSSGLLVGQLFVQEHHVVFSVNGTLLVLDFGRVQATHDTKVLRELLLKPRDRRTTEVES